MLRNCSQPGVGRSGSDQEFPLWPVASPKARGHLAGLIMSCLAAALLLLPAQAQTQNPGGGGGRVPSTPIAVQIVNQDLDHLVAPGKSLNFGIDPRPVERTESGQRIYRIEFVDGSVPHGTIAGHFGLANDLDLIRGEVIPNAEGGWDFHAAPSAVDQVYRAWASPGLKEEFIAALADNPVSRPLINARDLPNSEWHWDGGPDVIRAPGGGLLKRIYSLLGSTGPSVGPTSSRTRVDSKTNKAATTDEQRRRGKECADLGYTWEDFFLKRLQRLQREDPSVDHIQNPLVDLPPGTASPGQRDKRDQDFLIRLDGDNYWATEQTTRNDLKAKLEGQIPKDIKSLSQRPSATLNGRPINIIGKTYVLMSTPSPDMKKKLKEGGLTWVDLLHGTNNYDGKQPPEEAEFQISLGREPPAKLQEKLFQKLFIPGLPKNYRVEGRRTPARPGANAVVAAGEAASAAAVIVSILRPILKARADTEMAQEVWNKIGLEVAQIQVDYPKGQTTWVRITTGGPEECTEDSAGQPLGLGFMGYFTVVDGDAQDLGPAPCQAGTWHDVPRPESTIAREGWLYNKFDECVAGTGTQEFDVSALSGVWYLHNWPGSFNLQASATTLSGSFQAVWSDDGKPHAHRDNGKITGCQTVRPAAAKCAWSGSYTDADKDITRSGTITFSSTGPDSLTAETTVDEIDSESWRVGKYGSGVERGFAAGLTRQPQ